MFQGAGNRLKTGNTGHQLRAAVIWIRDGQVGQLGQREFVAQLIESNQAFQQRAVAATLRAEAGQGVIRHIQPSPLIDQAGADGFRLYLAGHTTPKNLAPEAFIGQAFENTFVAHAPLAWRR